MDCVTHDGDLAVGIDGCRAGWIAAFLVSGRASFEVFDSIESAWGRVRHARSVLIDIPIGLGESKRRCDQEAKSLLGRHNSRVFLSPPREAAFAANYPEANRLCRLHAGFGLSKQSWNILPKVREVDLFLAATPAARRIVRECHPEVCFTALAGSPIEASKKTSEGAASRAKVLAPYVDRAEQVIRQASESFLQKNVARDDIVDALVAAVTASAPNDKFRTIPPVPTRDRNGLAMEMVYRVP